MAPRKFIVTSGLPYSNGPLHVGHVAGAYLPADTYVRYLRLRGEDVRFVCGSDDNGVAAVISSRKEGRSVEELTARYNARQQADFAGLRIEFDIFGGTHQPGFVERHEQISQEFFSKIYEKGYFTKKTTKQFYDPVEQQFLPDRYIQGTCYHTRGDGSPCAYAQAYGDQCEQCGKTIDPMLLSNPRSTLSGTRPEPRSTTHWYLRLEKFEEPLREWLESKRQPSGDDPAWRESVLNFVLGQIRQGLPERAMTRDLDWGIRVPLDDPDAQGKMLYVWFDAPIGYVSFTAALSEQRDGDWKRYEDWWKNPDCRIVHFIGEDNTIFHALIWPAMLMAEGSFELPRHVVASKFLNIKFPGQEEQKISKSRGNAIWIEKYLESFDPDPLRYYLTAVAPESQRTTFDVDDFIARNNGELLNALGNFVNRALIFAQRYFDGTVPEVGERCDADLGQLELIARQTDRTAEHLEGFRFRAALREVMSLARASNGYFDVKRPWQQRKDSLEACGTTINVCIQTVRALAVLMAPFLPDSAEKCLKMLRLDGGCPTWDDAKRELDPGHALGEPVILFKKLDAAELFTEAQETKTPEGP